MADQVKHIQEQIKCNKALSLELENSKVSEAESEKRINKAELKVFEVESKLLEAEANYATLTSKVEGLEKEKSWVEERENEICMEVFQKCQE